MACANKSEDRHTQIYCTDGYTGGHRYKRSVINGLKLCKSKQDKQDHFRGVYLPPSIKGEEILFPRYSHFSFSAKIENGHQKWRKLKFFS